MKRKYVFLSVIAALIITAVAVWTLCNDEKEKYEGMRVQETPLKEFIDLPEDSSCLVFMFVPSCKYCQNSVANLNEYEKTGVVDKVVGLTLKDSIGEKYFIRHYQPAFPIIGCDIQKLLAFNNRFPTSYYIENSVIVKVFRGELPEGKKFFKKSKKKIKQCGI
ncbi:MAG: hypothetical protein LBF39_02705 [Prevotellaceae bacterium]|jgi:hypothetical protein|nr:hypothetical protein [Prevotellaceae bacterium]